MTDQQFKDAAAKCTTQEEKMALGAEFFRPEAKEIIAIATTGVVTTRNGYGRVMQVLSGMPKVQQVIMLMSLDLEGYPEARTLSTLLGVKVQFLT